MRFNPKKIEYNIYKYNFRYIIIKMNDKNIVFSIIKEHIIEIIKILEKQRYSMSNITLKINNNSKLKESMFHSEANIIINKHLEVILNYMHHMININKDESLNEIFNEIRMNIFIHNSCLIQKYVDFFKIIYDNISVDELDYSNLENYLDSIICQSELIFKLFKNDIFKSLTICNQSCKMIYDPQINPIKIN
jgi:hypothetical protein